MVEALPLILEVVVAAVDVRAATAAPAAPAS
jgi:hypothetical protein